MSRPGHQIVQRVARVDLLGHQGEVGRAAVDAEPLPGGVVGVDDAPAPLGHHDRVIALEQIHRHDRAQRVGLRRGITPLRLAHQGIEPGKENDARDDQINFNHRRSLAARLMPADHHSVSTGGSASDPPRRRFSAASSVISRISANWRVAFEIEPIARVISGTFS